MDTQFEDVDHVDEERVALQEDVSAERDEVMDTQFEDDDHVDLLNASVNYIASEREPQTTTDDLDGTINDDSPILETPGIQETLVAEEPLSTSVVEEEPVTYTLLPTGSKFGKPIVVGSDGYAYSMLKELKNGGHVWRCSQRGKIHKCQAKVTSLGHKYQRNTTLHVHPADPSLLYKKELSAKIKAQTSQHVYQSERDIATTSLDDRGQHQNLPEAVNLTSTANCQLLRPPTLSDFNFKSQQRVSTV